MIQKIEKEKYCFFKSPDGASFILESHINYQKDLFKRHYSDYIFRQTRPCVYFPAQTFEKPSESLIPNKCELVGEVNDRIYNCSFSLDGQKFLLSTQRGMMVYSYNEDDNNEENKSNTEINSFKLEADINAYDISWTITDADLSYDKKFLIHSTLNPILHCFDLEKKQYVRSFNISPEILSANSFYYSSCPVFSIKISGDNSELIAGCGRTSNDRNMKIFNIEKNRVTQNIAAHKRDINSICYLDRDSSAIFLSASDDGFGKVWDLRALGMNQNCAGYLIGHHSGLTSISSRGDHRYCATNSKDQSLKIWDIRKLASTAHDKKIDFHNYDYRMENLSVSTLEKFKKATNETHFDNSISTFYGHKVLRTLIRCHFSPETMTNCRYVYTGSACGRVFIWDIFTGQTVAEYFVNNRNIVRDCVWHPFQPTIIMTNLEGMIYKLKYQHSSEYALLEPNEKKEKEEDLSEGEFQDFSEEEDEGDFY